MKIKFSKTDKVAKNTALVVMDPQSDDRIVEKNGQTYIQLGGYDREKLNHRKIIPLARRIISAAKKNKIAKIAVAFKDLCADSMNEGDIAELITINFGMANYEFSNYKTRKKSHFVEEITLICDNPTQEIKDAVSAGQAAAEEINACRDLVNTPSNDLTPPLLSKAAKDLFANTKVKVKVLGPKEITEEKMGGILEVARGSYQDAQLIVVEYNNNGKNPPIALVGKAVTYDTGGLCIKPGPSMNDMHMDMAGGAIVLHTIALAAKLGVKQNIIGIVPSVENSLGENSYRPGDIITMMSGLTVEILNTDAEGRLILADALTYTQKYYKPSLTIDIATLTGASRIALGSRACAIFTKDLQLENTCRELGEQTGNYVWPLPLWEEYDQEIEGRFADIANIQTHQFSKFGGAIIAATFLHQFIKDKPWLHIDIAPRMTAFPGDLLASGATAEPLRLLVKLLENHVPKS